MKALVLPMAFAVACTAQSLNSNIVTIIPASTRSAVGQLRLRDKQSTPHYLAIEGPDSIGSNTTLKFDSSFTAGTLCVTGSGPYTVTTSGCVGSITDFTVTGGTIPGSGSNAGLYGGRNSGSRASWLIDHDGVGSGSTLQVGAQSFGGSTNAYTLYGSTGTILMTASTQITLTGPIAVSNDITSTAGFIGKNIFLDGGTIPTAGSNSGLFSGYNTTSRTGWMVAHDQTGSGDTLQVGAQNSSGTNTYALFGSSGTILLAASGGITTAGAFSVGGVTTFAGDVLPDANNSRPLGSSSFRYSKVWAVDADLTSATIGTCTGCSPSNMQLTNGTIPGSGSNAGLYGGRNSGSRASWLIDHDGTGSGSTLQVGAQASGGGNNAYTLYGSNGTILESASSTYTLIASSFAVGPAITSYNGNPTFGQGVGAFTATATGTGITAASTTITLTINGSTPPAGLYRWNFHLACSTTTGSSTTNFMQAYLTYDATSSLMYAPQGQHGISCGSSYPTGSDRPIWYSSAITHLDGSSPAQIKLVTTDGSSLNQGAVKYTVYLERIE